VVTSHVNFVAGRLHVPVTINGRIEENPATEEVLLHRSHVILIDEIDAFQASLIGNSAHGLQLAKRRGTPLSPLRQLDGEFNDGALGRIGTRIEGRVHAALTQSLLVDVWIWPWQAEQITRVLRRRLGMAVIHWG
jgi:hypothetical protein